MASCDMLAYDQCSTLFLYYKLDVFTLLHKAHKDGLPELLYKDICIKRCNGYSLRGKDCLLVPRFNTRYMKYSIAYRASILWNTVSFNGHGVSRLKQRELKRRLKTKCYFKDFKFNVVSVSTVQHRDDDFIYI